ncbi:MAG: chemotaxis protein CheA [Clostridia bacterium]|nr:chemotaxis protein CheA [Clostridia bacterium]
MDMSQYLEIFIEESKEHLQGLNQSLLQLEKNPSDVSVLNEIFRVAHTLKGMSGTMGFSKMAKLTHDMEDVLHALRNNEIKVNTKMIDILFKCLDALENYVNSIVNSGSEGKNDYADIIQELSNILHNKSSEPETSSEKPAVTATAAAGASDQAAHAVAINQYDQNVINKASEIGMNAYEISVILNKGCVLKSARAFIIFQTLERYGEIIKSEPSVQDIEDERFEFEFTVVVISKESASLFEKEINSIAEVEKVIVQTLEAKVTNDVQPAQVEASVQQQGGQVAALTSNAEEKDEHEAAAAKKAKTGKTVRVDIDRLDVLMNLVSELIIIKTRLEGIDNVDASQTYNEAVEYLERITTNLHDAVMKVRMVPVENVFNRFPRVIRDISRELGKEIVLTMSGEETELDRTVIDEIGDPLLHLLRNSADHGIESLEKRRQAGKKDEGHIYLRAYQDGNNVVIEVEDDGAGINVDKVRNKAIERGLISKEMASTMSQKDIVEFLFKPSFSTADKITDISGRGVGLDVVKTKIEALGGLVEVETEMGKGSKFIIRLPLTLAIIQALLVLIGEEKYAIPLNSIKEIINISPNDIKMVQKQEVILLRNMVVPIVRLDKILDVPKEQKEPKQLTVVIVKKGDKLSGFLVDNLIGQQEIVIKSLGKFLSGIKFIAGATILGDGNVALIIDVNSLA